MKTHTVPMAFRLSTGRVYSANIVTEITVRREPLANPTLSLAELREGQALADAQARHQEEEGGA